jgi:hypothetical protein
LWEERFAARAGDQLPRSISHVSARDLEAWCLDQTTIPARTVARQAGEGVFWIRLTYRIDDEERSTSRDDEGGFTLRGLIDRLSRRGAASAWTDTIVSGPLRSE